MAGRGPGGLLGSHLRRRRRHQTTAFMIPPLFARGSACLALLALVVAALRASCKLEGRSRAGASPSRCEPRVSLGPPRSGERTVAATITATYRTTHIHARAQHTQAGRQAGDCFGPSDNARLALPLCIMGLSSREKAKRARARLRACLRSSSLWRAEQCSSGASALPKTSACASSRGSHTQRHARTHTHTQGTRG